MEWPECIDQDELEMVLHEWRLVGLRYCTWDDTDYFLVWEGDEVILERHTTRYDWSEDRKRWERVEHR